MSRMAMQGPSPSDLKKRTLQACLKCSVQTLREAICLLMVRRSELVPRFTRLQDVGYDF